MTAGAVKSFGRMKTITDWRERLVELLFPSSDHMVIINAHPAFPLDKLEALLDKLQA